MLERVVLSDLMHKNKAEGELTQPFYVCLSAPPDVGCTSSRPNDLLNLTSGHGDELS
jgi:hypothetical protein